MSTELELMVRAAEANPHDRTALAALCDLLREQGRAPQADALAVLLARVATDMGYRAFVAEVPHVIDIQVPRVFVPPDYRIRLTMRDGVVRLAVVHLYDRSCRGIAIDHARRAVRRIGRSGPCNRVYINHEYPYARRPGRPGWVQDSVPLLLDYHT